MSFSIPVSISTNTFEKMTLTNDEVIRTALKKKLQDRYAKDEHPVKIFEELGVRHGAVRVDIAVVNGIMHGYEIKSDRDTLCRLSEQMKEFNAVFDKVTLVVGKRYLFDVINAVPEWWGVVVAKINTDNKIVFYTIREAEDNPEQVGVSIARLLWREEALRILKEENKEAGFCSKPRGLIYERLASVLDIDSLKKKVRDTLLVSREGWRSDVQLMLSGD